MKKLISCLLIASLLCACLPAFAEDTVRKTITVGEYTVTYDDEINFLPAEDQAEWEVYGSARVSYTADGAWMLRDGANYGANLLYLDTQDWATTDCVLLVYDFTLKGTFASAGIMLDWWSYCVSDPIAEQYGIPKSERGGDNQDQLPAGTYQGVLDVTELLRSDVDNSSLAQEYHSDITLLNVYLVTGQITLNTLKLVSGAQVEKAGE